VGSGDNLLGGGVEERADRDGVGVEGWVGRAAVGVEGKDDRADGGEAGKDDLMGGWLSPGLEEGGGQVTRGGGGSGPSRCSRSGSRLPPPRPTSTFFRILFLLRSGEGEGDITDWTGGGELLPPLPKPIQQVNMCSLELTFRPKTTGHD